MCDFILYFNDYVLHLCVINDDDMSHFFSFFFLNLFCLTSLHFIVVCFYHYSASTLLVG